MLKGEVFSSPVFIYRSCTSTCFIKLPVVMVKGLSKEQSYTSFLDGKNLTELVVRYPRQQLMQ